MDNNFGKLTVYFEDPFWVGVFERIQNGKLSVCKVIFGKQPKDCEVWQFILAKYYHRKFSPSVDAVVKSKPPIPNEYSEREESKLLLPEAGQNRSRLCNCNGKKIN